MEIICTVYGRQMSQVSGSFYKWVTLKWAVLPLFLKGLARAEWSWVSWWLWVLYGVIHRLLSDIIHNYISILVVSFADHIYIWVVSYTYYTCRYGRSHIHRFHAYMGSPVLESNVYSKWVVFYTDDIPIWVVSYTDDRYMQVVSYLCLLCARLHGWS